MNKRDVVEFVARCAGIPKSQARLSIDCYHDAIQEALASGEKVTLVGFGSFKVRKRKAREGRNPQTGGKIQIPAKKVPKFEPGRNLRDAVE